MDDEIDKRLAENEVRANAATAGPWRWPVAGGLSAPVGDHEEILIERLECAWSDGIFIAHARTEIPWLIKQNRMSRFFIREHAIASNACDSAFQQYYKWMKKIEEMKNRGEATELPILSG